MEKDGMMKENTSNKQTIEREDKKVLENILSIAHNLLGYNKGHKCFDWGQSLYDIHKYLEKKFNSKNIEKRKGSFTLIEILKLSLLIAILIRL